ncbi:MAG: hypothetical protein HRU13_09095 [Phycisphaerales bacterium]|nr:hypothetical protein [Phycisphaerales bacterium]
MTAGRNPAPINPPIPRKDQRISAKDQRDLRDAALAGVPRVRPTAQIAGLPGAGRVQAGAVQVAAFEIVRALGDYLVCKVVLETGEAGTATVNVAKPWQLRRTPFDGQTVNGIAYAYTGDNARTGTDSEDNTEDQQVTPDYFAGARILAIRGITGGTGVSVVQEQGGNVRPAWQDLNDAGRVWAQT